MATAQPIDMTEARRIAAAYPPEAKHTPRWEREAYLTDMQQLAWLIRFEPDAATLISSEGICMTHMPKGSRSATPRTSDA